MKKQLMSTTGLLLLIAFIIAVTPPVCAYADEPMRLDVPNFRQIWKPWGQENLGFGDRLIENAECALTSILLK